MKQQTFMKHIFPILVLIFNIGITSLFNGKYDGLAGLTMASWILVIKLWYDSYETKVVQKNNLEGK